MQDREASPAPGGGGQHLTRLVVGNLTRNVTEDHIREIFGHYGELKSAELAMDKTVNLPKGFAIIYLSWIFCVGTQGKLQYAVWE